MGNQEPHYTWIKGMESETDNKFRLIIGKYDSSITNNKLIEISPDKTIRFFGSVIMDKFTMSPGSLNGNSIQNGTISSDKLQSGITITGTLVGKADQAIKDNKGNVIDTFYAPKTELSKYLLKSENAVSATKAIQDGNDNNIVNTYATKTELNAKAPLANPTFTGTVTISGNGTFKGNLTGTADTAKSASAVAWANVSGKPGLIPTSGNAGTISTSETIANLQTVSATSPRSMKATSGATVTLQQGGAEAWITVVACEGAVTVNLGNGWAWSGSAPTLGKGLITCAWYGSFGIVNFMKWGS